MNRKYTVSMTVEGTIRITQTNGRGKAYRFTPAAFIRGCTSYDEDTDRYPNYVHWEVARLTELRRKQDAMFCHLSRSSREVMLETEYTHFIVNLETREVESGWSCYDDGFEALCDHSRSDDCKLWTRRYTEQYIKKWKD